MAKRNMSAWQVDNGWGLLWASKLELGFPEFPVFLQDTLTIKGTCMRLRIGRGKNGSSFFSFLTPWRSVWNPGAVTIHMNIVPGLLPHLKTWLGQLQHPLAPSFSSSKPWSSVCNSLQSTPAAAGHIRPCSLPLHVHLSFLPVLLTSDPDVK